MSKNVRRRGRRRARAKKGNWFTRLKTWQKIVFCLAVVLFCLVGAAVLYVAAKWNKINTQEINADYLNKGQTVEFSVDSPVIINGVTVIKAGTRATAEVLNKKNNFIFGIPGEIQVGNFKLNNGGSSPINMSGSITEKGSSRYWSHIGWLIVWSLLLVKGGDGVIPAGTRHTIYTIGDTYLNTNTYPVNYYNPHY